MATFRFAYTEGTCHTHETRVCHRRICYSYSMLHMKDRSLKDMTDLLGVSRDSHFAMVILSIHLLVAFTLRCTLLVLIKKLPEPGQHLTLLSRFEQRWVIAQGDNIFTNKINLKRSLCFYFPFSTVTRMPALIFCIPSRLCLTASFSVQLVPVGFHGFDKKKKQIRHWRSVTAIKQCQSHSESVCKCSAPEEASTLFFSILKVFSAIWSLVFH